MKSQNIFLILILISSSCSTKEKTDKELLEKES